MKTVFYNIVIIMLVFTPILSFSQNYQEEVQLRSINDDTLSLIRDFNEDGVIDTIKSMTDSEGLYSKFYFIDSGNSKQYIAYACYNPHYIKTVVVLPLEIIQGKNIGFLHRIMEIWEMPYQEKPDPSLQWVIDGWVNKPILKHKHQWIHKIVKFNPLWIKCPIEIPSRYYTFIKGESLVKSLYDSSCYSNQNKPKFACLIYYGNQHKLSREGDSSLYLRDTKKEDGHLYKVYITDRGVILQKDSLYSWVFVCDKGLTMLFTNDKIDRHPLIHNAKLFGKYIFIQVRPSRKTQKLYEYYIDIEKGICVQLSGFITDFKKDDKLTFSDFSLTKNYELEMKDLLDNEFDKPKNNFSFISNLSSQVFYTIIISCILIITVFFLMRKYKKVG